MFLFKSCRRCNGDMRLQVDISGDAFIHCLNCGHTVELPGRRDVRYDRLSTEKTKDFKRAS